MLNALKIILLIYFVAFAFICYFASKGNPPLIPGDIYFRRGARHVYVPVSSSLILALVIYFLFAYFAGKLSF